MFLSVSHSMSDIFRGLVLCAQGAAEGPMDLGAVSAAVVALQTATSLLSTVPLEEIPSADLIQASCHFLTFCVPDAGSQSADPSVQDMREELCGAAAAHLEAITASARLPEHLQANVVEIGSTVTMLLDQILMVQPGGRLMEQLSEDLMTRVTDLTTALFNRHWALLLSSSDVAGNGGDFDLAALLLQTANVTWAMQDLDNFLSCASMWERILPRLAQHHAAATIVEYGRAALEALVAGAFHCLQFSTNAEELSGLDDDDPRVPTPGQRGAAGSWGAGSGGAGGMDEDDDKVYVDNIVLTASSVSFAGSQGGSRMVAEESEYDLVYGRGTELQQYLQGGLLILGRMAALPAVGTAVFRESQSALSSKMDIVGPVLTGAVRAPAPGTSDSLVLEAALRDSALLLKLTASLASSSSEAASAVQELLGTAMHLSEQLESAHTQGHLYATLQAAALLTLRAYIPWIQGQYYLIATVEAGSAPTTSPVVTTADIYSLVTTMWSVAVRSLHNMIAPPPELVQKGALRLIKGLAASGPGVRFLLLSAKDPVGALENPGMLLGALPLRSQATLLEALTQLALLPASAAHPSMAPDTPALPEADRGNAVSQWVGDRLAVLAGLVSRVDHSTGVFVDGALPSSDAYQVQRAAICLMAFLRAVADADSGPKAVLHALLANGAEVFPQLIRALLQLGTVDVPKAARGRFSARSTIIAVAGDLLRVLTVWMHTCHTLLTASNIDVMLSSIHPMVSEFVATVILPNIANGTASSAVEVLRAYLSLLAVLVRAKASAVGPSLPAIIQVLTTDVRALLEVDAGTALHQSAEGVQVTGGPGVMGKSAGQCVGEILPVTYIVLRDILVHHWRSFIVTGAPDPATGRRPRAYANEEAQTHFENILSMVVSALHLSDSVAPDVLRMQLQALNAVDDAQRLFSFQPFVEGMARAFQASLLRIIWSGRHDTVQEVVCQTLYSMARHDFEGFFSQAVPEFVGSDCPSAMGQAEEAVGAAPAGIMSDESSFASFVVDLVHDLRMAAATAEAQ